MMVWYASSANYTRDFTLQTDWDYGRGTYNCTPMMVDEYWGNKFNFDTCQELARPPKISTPQQRHDSVIWVLVLLCSCALVLLWLWWLSIPISQVFSLAYALLLLYTVFSALCVKIFFAAKKEPEGESAAKANGENKV